MPSHADRCQYDGDAEWQLPQRALPVERVFNARGQELGATFRLDLLRIKEAREAIQKPARDVGVDFTGEAADKLVDDLCKVLVAGADGKVEQAPGLYVEPVQLQVACRNLWAKWKERLASNTGMLIDPARIRPEHLDEVNVKMRRAISTPFTLRKVR